MADSLVMKHENTWLALAQPVATLLVAAAVTALTLVEVGVIPSKRVTTQVYGGGGSGLSSYDTISVNVENWPSYINASVSNTSPIDVRVMGSVYTKSGY